METFWNKVQKSNDCWRWIGRIESYGYGRFYFKGKLILAHRMAYELLVGEIKEGLQLDHLCRNRWCVNPAHLEQVTQKQNILRGVGAPAKNARKKNCPKCGSEYSLYSNGKSGKTRRCKPCSIASCKKHYQLNRDKYLGMMKISSKKHYQLHKEKYLVKMKERYQLKKEDIKEYSRKWYLANKEKIRERKLNSATSILKHQGSTVK